MDRIVGIDLGTTNSLVATVDSGIPLVIADAEGRRLTPSVVHFPGSDVEPLVGAAANRVRVLKPTETVYSVKRFIGRRGADISKEEMLVTFPVQSQSATERRSPTRRFNSPGQLAESETGAPVPGKGNAPITIPIHGREYTPEEIS